MIKLICCLCIVTGTFLYGNLKAMELLKRERFLEGVISALTVIRQDIAYCKTPLFALFERLNAQKEYGGLLIFNLPETDDGRKVSDLFRENILGLQGKLCIHDEDIFLLCEFVSSVESSDTETAVAVCHRTTEQLRQRAAAAHEKTHTNGRLYSTMGLFAGIAAVLFFI